MRQKSDVTIIIPNLNGEEFLYDCLKSIADQTCRCAVIIVDDGSKASSFDKAKEITEKFSDYLEIKLIRHANNEGFASSVNTGIKLADTRYVLLLNNDTTAENDMAEKLLNAITALKNAFSVSALMLSMNDKEKIDDAGDFYCALGWAFSDGRDKPRDKFQKRRHITSACAGAAIYDREKLVTLGLFDESHFCYLEDVDIGLRAKRAGLSNYFEPKAVVYHKGSATSGSRYNSFKTKLTTANGIYLIYKNFPLWLIVLNLPLFLSGIIIKGVFYIKNGLGAAFFGGLIEGMGRIRNSRFERAKTVNFPRDIFLYFELLGNCIRRVF